jgi:hypothetical protein
VAALQQAVRHERAGVLVTFFSKTRDQRSALRGA